MVHQIGVMIAEAFPMASGLAQATPLTLAEARATPPSTPGIHLVKMGIFGASAGTYITDTTRPAGCVTEPRVDRTLARFQRRLGVGHPQQLQDPAAEPHRTAKRRYAWAACVYTDPPIPDLVSYGQSHRILVRVPGCHDRNRRRGPEERRVPRHLR